MAKKDASQPKVTMKVRTETTTSVTFTDEQVEAILARASGLDTVKGFNLEVRFNCSMDMLESATVSITKVENTEKQVDLEKIKEGVE